MILRTDEQVTCYHQKFRLINYDLEKIVGYSHQCVDCFDTYLPGEKISSQTVYSLELFDQIVRDSQILLEQDRIKNKIIEPI